jgi:hypothetical protein
LGGIFFWFVIRKRGSGNTGDVETDGSDAGSHNSAGDYTSGNPAAAPIGHHHNDDARSISIPDIADKFEEDLTAGPSHT